MCSDLTNVQSNYLPVLVLHNHVEMYYVGWYCAEVYYVGWYCVEV